MKWKSLRELREHFKASATSLRPERGSRHDACPTASSEGDTRTARQSHHWREGFALERGSVHQQDDSLEANHAPPEQAARPPEESAVHTLPDGRQSTGSSSQAPSHEHLELLESSTNILVHAVQAFIIRGSEVAIHAQKRIQKTNETRDDDERWHLSMYLALLSLEDATKDWRGRNFERSDEIATVINDVLNTFGQLVAVKATACEETSSSSHLLLKELEKEYALDKLDHRRPKPLHHRKWLYCPPLVIRRKLKEDVERCTALLRAPDKDDIVSEARIIKEWHPPSSLSVHVPLIRVALENQWPCKCKHVHKDAFLAFTSSKDQDTLGSYEVCLSLINDNHANASLRLSRFDAPVPCQESLPVVVSRKRVNMADPNQLPPAQWLHCADICNAFKRGPGHYTLQTRQAALKCEVLRPQIYLRSLRRLLETNSLGEVFNLQEQMVLGLILAYTYLYASDTDFWRTGEDEPDFWICGDGSRDRFQIFLRYPVSTNKATSTHGLPGDLNPRRPSLPGLGKLLFEIYRGTAVSWEDLYRRLNEPDTTLPLLKKYWRFAIKTCLRDINEPGDLRKDKAIRSIFVDRVVKSLQCMIEKCMDSSFERILAECRTTGRPTVIARRPARMYYRPARMYFQPAMAQPDVTGSLDENDRQTPQRKEKIDSARRWQYDLQNRVYDVLFSTGADSPAKIAILDTGISLAGKEHMYRDVIQDYRSWVGVNDMINGEVQGWANGDTDGHGTFAVDILRQTNPACEIYVAKVFEGQQQKERTAPVETQQAIANAMRFAVEEWKVDAISMSFGYLKPVDAIEKQISSAASNKVAMFAAASNYGGMGDESWPACDGQVLCVHAIDGLGNGYNRNTTATSRNGKYGVIGVEVEGLWNDGRKAHKSGTSVATPIAAGIASLFIQFLRNERTAYLDLPGNSSREEEYDRLLLRMKGPAAMRDLFESLAAPERNGYRPINPWQLIEGEECDKVYLIKRLLNIIGAAK